MAQSGSRFVKVYVPFDKSVFIDAIKLGFIFCIGFVMMYYGLFSSGALAAIISITGGLIVLAVAVTPIFKALNVAPRDSELLAIKNNKKTQDLSVSHPYAFLIILITIFFGFTFIGWVVAFVWAYAPGNVNVPRWAYEEMTNSPMDALYDE